MEGKVFQLTEKLLKEGVEQGEKRKDEIIAAANKQAEEIIEAAKKQAENIVNDADKAAENAKKNAENEIKLSGQQALNALKLQITDMVSAKAVDSAVSDSLAKNIPEYIKAVLSNWKGDNSSVDVLLSPAQVDALKRDIETAVKNVVKGGINIAASKSIKNGFLIGETNGSFKVSFTDSDFAEYFKEFLRPKVKSILFGE